MSNLIITPATNSMFCMNCGQPSEHYAKQFPSDPAKRLCTTCIKKWDWEIREAKLKIDREIEELKSEDTITKEDNKSSTQKKVQIPVENSGGANKEQPKSNEVKEGIVPSSTSNGTGNGSKPTVQTGGIIPEPNP